MAHYLSIPLAQLGDIELSRLFLNEVVRAYGGGSHYVVSIDSQLVPAWTGST
jgi:hypothetical protein